MAAQTIWSFVRAYISILSIQPPKIFLDLQLPL